MNSSTERREGAFPPRSRCFCRSVRLIPANAPWTRASPHSPLSRPRGRRIIPAENYPLSKDQIGPALQLFLALQGFGITTVTLEPDSPGGLRFSGDNQRSPSGLLSIRESQWHRSIEPCGSGLP
jgi:hypothetical protein